ncbi:MAG: lipopolysaccharide heptosyltransferase II [Candidatus Omnitrophica bacterium]|nr:lipopolysaccharide heptosyltransferase II [Candidatus Omnitrophota bacterium]MCB9748225.1 lipopolysaccharide heptosyltransferase II [Candidatus Omnitrophota bacterium]
MIKNTLYKMIAVYCAIYRIFFKKEPLKINASDIKKVLIIFTHGIGDMCMFMPALDMVFSRFPHAQIDILTTPSALTVLNNQYAFGKIKFLHLQNSLREQKQIAEELRKEHYDLSLVGVVSPGIEDAAFLSWQIKAKYRIGPKNRPVYTHTFHIKEGVHDAVQNGTILRQFFHGEINFKDRPKIHIADEQKKAALNEMGINDGGKYIIGIHPGGLEVDKYRRWPEENFAQLADLLIESCQARIVFFEGPEEYLLADRICAKMQHKALIIRGKPLKSVMEMIKACHLFISSDSGLGHIAAAVDVPVLAIFGPADPRRTSPFGNKVWIVRKDLKCSPCYHKTGYCTQIKRYCLEDISSNEVFQRILKIMKVKEDRFYEKKSFSQLYSA